MSDHTDAISRESAELVSRKAHIITTDEYLGRRLGRHPINNLLEMYAQGCATVSELLDILDLTVTRGHTDLFNTFTNEIIQVYFYPEISEADRQVLTEYLAKRNISPNRTVEL